jgi:hypothetical protein
MIFLFHGHLCRLYSDLDWKGFFSGMYNPQDARFPQIFPSLLNLILYMVIVPQKSLVSILLLELVSILLLELESCTLKFVWRIYRKIPWLVLKLLFSLRIMNGWCHLAMIVPSRPTK